MRQMFLAGAHAVLAAISIPEAAERWDEPSCLEDQTIGSLVGHLSRGSVWAIDDYLDLEVPDQPLTFATTAEYFAELMDWIKPSDHEDIRARGAALAEEGADALVSKVRERITKLETRLPAEPTDRRLPVIGGRMIELDPYLGTRIVEQTVHLDDLARSLDREPFAIPDENVAFTLAIGAEIGRLRRGGPAMIRSLFRDGPTDSVLPVL